MNGIVKKLQEANLQIENYSRGPFGKDIFAISISPEKQGGVIKLYEGNAKIEAISDSDFRQAVLHVKEQPRVITRKMTMTAYFSHSLPQMKRRLKQDFPVSVPRGAKFSFSNMAQTGKDGYYLIKGTVTAHIKQRTEMNFLIGFDENYNFISALPRRASSVEDAHNVLKPRSVTGNYKRQGEFFFVPVSTRTTKILNNIAETSPRKIKEAPLEKNSSHSAKQRLMQGKTQYVIGYIHDKRTSHHRGLYLETWHKVVRNKEVMPQSPVQAKQRRTWD